MSTDIGSRARAAAAWNALSDAERGEIVAPADGLAASMAPATWILGHMAGQQDAQQYAEMAIQQLQRVADKAIQASAEEIARLQGQLSDAGIVTRKVTEAGLRIGRGSAAEITRLTKLVAANTGTIDAALVDKITRLQAEIDRLARKETP